MSTKRHPLTESEASSPRVSCDECGRKHSDENPLVRVSIKTMHVDDYHYECQSGPCIYGDD